MFKVGDKVRIVKSLYDGYDSINHLVDKEGEIVEVRDDFAILSYMIRFEDGKVTDAIFPEEIELV